MSTYYVQPQMQHLMTMQMAGHGMGQVMYYPPQQMYPPQPMPQQEPMSPNTARKWQNNPYAAVTEETNQHIVYSAQDGSAPQPQFMAAQWQQPNVVIVQQQAPASAPAQRNVPVPKHIRFGNRNADRWEQVQAHHSVSLQEVLQCAGTFTELARTANGSSFIQAALREDSDQANLGVIWGEIQLAFSDLILDAHGCYVIKSIMERLPPAELQQAVAKIATDDQLTFSMCTHSLHTRRVVQFLLDTVDCSFIHALLTSQCAAIAKTQQGCIVMQRAMDVAVGPVRNNLFNAIYSNILDFAIDPFANYVVQHLLEVHDRDAASVAVISAFRGHVVQLSCNKFASNVMEKALFHLTAESQHELLMEMYSGGEDVLYRMLQDSFGNYLIQSSIALAAYKDVFFMAEALRPVLQRTPYGHKIEARLDRRLKGKPVGTRSPMIGTFGRGFGRKPPHHSAQQQRAPGTDAPAMDAPAPQAEQGEEPW